MFNEKVKGIIIMISTILLFIALIGYNIIYGEFNKPIVVNAFIDALFMMVTSIFLGLSFLIGLEKFGYFKK